jgi:pimeloyl-ACP methyl ester carboxylesterase
LVRHGIRTLPLGLARQSVRLAMAHDTRASLGLWRGPTLLMRGEREAPWMSDAERELATLLPRAQRCVSPGVSHLHPLSAPQWFADTIETWLRSLPRKKA